MNIKDLETWFHKNEYTQHPQICGGYFKDVGFSYPIGFIVAENGDVDYCQLTNGHPIVVKSSSINKLSVNSWGKLVSDAWKKTGKQILI